MADLFKLWRHSKVVVPSKHKYDANDLVHDMHKEAKARRADKKKYGVKQSFMLSSGDMLCIRYAEYGSSGIKLTCTVNDADDNSELSDRFTINTKRNKDGEYVIKYNGDTFSLSDEEMDEILQVSKNS